MAMVDQIEVKEFEREDALAVASVVLMISEP